MIDNTTAVSFINSMGVEASTVIQLPGNYGFGVPTMEYGCLQYTSLERKIC